MLQFMALLLGNSIMHESGYREISRPNQFYPVMAKYDKDGILRYCDGKRAGKPVGGKKSIVRREQTQSNTLSLSIELPDNWGTKEFYDSCGMDTGSMDFE